MLEAIRLPRYTVEPMGLTASLLYLAAKALSRTDIAHSAEMKAALSTPEAQQAYRATQARPILLAAHRYGVPIAGRRVLDFGCHQGTLSAAYLEAGARSVVGVDIDASAVERGRALYPVVAFHVGSRTAIPLPDASVDVCLSYDVFEHVADPAAILRELRRVLVPGGTVLIGTWGWRHPFAPHLWATMPVPWAHLLVSEATLLAACRHVYESAWYVPTHHDLDEMGQRKAKYRQSSISREYLNHFLICDFETAFRAAGFACQAHLVP